MNPIVQLFDEVRLLNHRLVQVADRLHAGGTVSTPGRAVLEYLRNNGPSTVPAIARSRYVTRQHVQAIVDTLAGNHLVEAIPNPAHRTSPLISLTADGRDAFAAMQHREQRLLQALEVQIDEGTVAEATQVLAAIRSSIDLEEAIT